MLMRGLRMTTINENSSAVIPRRMQKAVEDKKRLQRRAAAIEGLLDLRRKQSPVSDKTLARARRADRA